MRERSRMKRIGMFCLIGLFCEGILFQGQVTAQGRESYLLPGDVREGWQVFNDKKCIQCHSIWGEGGKEGPDLGRLSESYASQDRLASMMWNHAPEMWARMAAKKIQLPEIDRREMANLFAFLYFIRYVDEAGNPQKGKDLMETKACAQCHSVTAGTKGDLSHWGTYSNSILWAQMMWNHPLPTEEEAKVKELPRVKFEGFEMVDLVSYIRSLNPKPKIYLSPGDPAFGERSFAQRACIRCHTPSGEYDLEKRKYYRRTVAQFAGMMWNHSQELWKEMEEKGIEYRSFSTEEMADMVAYLFQIRYFDEPGDPVEGKTVFIRKQCNLCHAKKSKIRDLSGLKGQISPIFMAQALWNHGPEMLRRLKEKKIPWQKFYYREMADLMEYLNQGMP